MFSHAVPGTGVWRFSPLSGLKAADWVTASDRQVRVAACGVELDAFPVRRLGSGGL